MEEMEMTAEELGTTDTYIEFRDDRTATFSFDGEIDEGKYEIRGNEIFDPDYDDEDNSRMIILELTSLNLTLEFIDEMNTSIIMNFKK